MLPVDVSFHTNHADAQFARLVPSVLVWENASLGSTGVDLSSIERVSASQNVIDTFAAASIASDVRASVT